MSKLTKCACGLLGLLLLMSTVVGCGGATGSADPKALAEEAAKLDKQTAEGEKGL